MSLYLCLPAPTLQGSSEEFKSKNVKGLKCPPSQSPVIINNPTFCPALRDLNAIRYLRICKVKAGEAKIRPHEYETGDTGRLPDLSLPLPKLVFATITALTNEKLKALSARRYMAGRTKYKHVYTISNKTTIEVLAELKKLKLEEDYVAPSGFCTPKSAHAFIVIRKLVSASLSTLFDAPAGSRIVPEVAKDYPTHSVVDVTVQEMAVEGAENSVSVPSVEPYGSLQSIKPNQIPSKASWGYFYLPYFKGMIGSDKGIIRRALVDMSLALDKDPVKALQIVNSLISVAEKPLEGEQGRVVSHLAACAMLAKDAGLTGYSICPAGEYVGTVLVGDKRAVASDAEGFVRPAGDYASVHELVSSASTSLAAKERLAALIADLEIDDSWKDDENADFEAADVEKLSSSYAIYYLLNARSEAFEASENNMKVARECASYMDFSGDTRREFTSEGLDDFISWMVNDEVPYSLDDGKNRFMNLNAINFATDTWIASQGVFGGVSFSPIWPGGKRINLPAPGADKFTKPREVLVKKGDKMEKTMQAELDSLVFVRCSPVQAAKDWKLVHESGAIWQPEKTLTRKEKLANLVWTGDSFVNGWETLKKYFHKEKSEGPATKKAKKGEEDKKDVPAPIVDISGLSAW